MAKLAIQPKIDDCPKNMKRCIMSNCPMFKDCWAYQKYEQQLDREQARKDDGWE